MRIISHNIGTTSLAERPAKLLLYKELIAQYDPHVIALQETRGIPEDHPFLGPEGYVCVAQWQGTPKCGGVALLIHASSVISSPITLHTDQFERRMDICATFVALKSQDTPQFVGVACAYYPPVSPSFQETSPDAVSSTIRGLPDGVDILLADFNSMHHCWSPLTTTGYDGSRARGAQIYSVTRETDWNVANDRTATYPSDDPKSTPDIVLVQRHLSTTYRVIDTCSPATLAAASTHRPISVTLRLSQEHHVGPHKHRTLRISWHRLRSWKPVESFKLLDAYPDAAQHFKSYMSRLHSLLRSLPQSSRSRPPQFSFPEELESLRSDADQAIATGSEDRMLKVQAYRRGISTYFADQEKQRFDAFLTGPKDALWLRKVWRAYKNRTPPLPPAIVSDTGAPLTPRQQAGCFRTLFASKHAASTYPEAKAYLEILQNELAQMRTDPPSEAAPQVTPVEVRTAISHLNHGQSSDTEGISPLLLDHFSDQVITSLASMFTRFLHEGYVPPQWRSSVVIPLYKGAPKPVGATGSYRPVAITDLLCRVLESILVRRLHWLFRADPFSPHQVGFRPGLSADCAIFHLVSSLSEGLRYRMKWHHEEDKQKDLQYGQILVAVDFSDAFCRVTPEKVEWALRRRKVNPYICRWIRSYMEHRTLRVWVNGRLSGTSSCEVGCPQGSIIGPFLWLVAMDDLLGDLEAVKQHFHRRLFPVSKSKHSFDAGLDREFSTLLYSTTGYAGDNDPPIPWDSPTSLPSVATVLLPICDFVAYADDLSLWVCAPCPRMAVAATQVMLNRVGRWADKNGVAVSTKTEARWISNALRTSLKLPPFPVQFSVGSHFKFLLPPYRGHPSAPSPSPLRILGLRIDPQLTFTDHVNYLKEKVESLLFDLDQQHPFMAPSLRALIVPAVIHSRLLYALPLIWSTLSKGAASTMVDLWHLSCRSITGCMVTTRREALPVTAGFRSVNTVMQQRFTQFMARLATLPDVEFELYTTALGKLTPRGIPAHRQAKQTETASHRLSTRSLYPSPRDALGPLWALPPSRQRIYYSGYHQVDYSTLAAAAQRSTFHTSLFLDGQRIRKNDPDTPIEVLQEFNKRQLEGTPAPMEVWTDGSVEHSFPDDMPSGPLIDLSLQQITSGGAWILIKDGESIKEGTVSLGSAACSYSMERRALRSALEDLLDVVSLDTPCTSLRVVTDSLSVLSELQRGPMYQCEEDMEAIWYLVSKFPALHIDWVFIFSHTEDNPGAHTAPLLTDFNAKVDKLASGALSASASPGVGQWGKDLFRPKLQHLLFMEDMSPSLADTFQGRTIGHGQPTPLLRLHCSRHDQMLLCQVRAGACRRLPGWRHHHPEPCVWCGKTIGRYSDTTSAGTRGVQEAVHHLFFCPGYPTDSARPPLSSLFDVDPSRELIEYLRSFVTGPVTGHRLGTPDIEAQGGQNP